MAYPWMPPVYNVSGRTNNWLNGIVTHHDTFCGCDKPFYHLFFHLKKNSGYPQCSPQELKLIEKCLTTRGDATTADAGTSTDQQNADITENFDFGDLELLFEENGDGENIDG